MHGEVVHWQREKEVHKWSRNHSGRGSRLNPCLAICGKVAHKAVCARQKVIIVPPGLVQPVQPVQPHCHCEYVAESCSSVTAMGRQVLAHGLRGHTNEGLLGADSTSSGTTERPCSPIQLWRACSAAACPVTGAAARARADAVAVAVCRRGWTAALAMWTSYVLLSL